MSASRFSLPAWTCCMTAVQVNSFETEPGRKSVRLGSTGLCALEVRIAEAAHRQRLAILDDHDDRARECRRP